MYRRIFTTSLRLTKTLEAFIKALEKQAKLIKCRMALMQSTKPFKYLRFLVEKKEKRQILSNLLWCGTRHQSFRSAGDKKSQVSTTITHTTTPTLLKHMQNTFKKWKIILIMNLNLCCAVASSGLQLAAGWAQGVH